MGRLNRTKPATFSLCLLLSSSCLAFIKMSKECVSTFFLLFYLEIKDKDIYDIRERNADTIDVF